MTFALSDIELWERKADKLEQWAKDKPENWIKANNKRFPFNKNKILGQRFAFHEIDTNTEPLKGLDDILRQIRWGKPSTADVLQKKYDEFFANLRASFPLIQNGDDCFWAVLVLRGDAFDLAKELRNIAQIARNELTPGEPAEAEQNIAPPKCWRIVIKKITGCIFKKTWRLISAIIVGLIVAVLVIIFGDFGWIDQIKDFIYNILQLE